MIVRAVRLVNFRCYERYALECRDETTLILGANGCGKTSVLEGVYEALQGKSFRAVDKEIVRRGEGFYRVDLARTDGEEVVVKYREEGGKEFLVQGKTYRRLPAKLKYPVILFEPDDLGLVGTSPTKRRAYFDRMIAQLFDGYSGMVSKYEKALRQRNEILKGEYANAVTLYPWDTMLAQLGVKIREKRDLIAQEINSRLTAKYHTIADNADDLRFDYGTEGTETEEGYLERLQAAYERDRVLGHTTYGVHRDDYDFLFNRRGADGTASRGEVRSIILALKFIEADLIEKFLRKKPVILLDDVFSELDDERQKALKTNFRDNQIILTSVK